MEKNLGRLGVGVVIALVIGTSGLAHAQAGGAWVGDPGSLTADLSYHYVPSSAVVLDPNMSVADRPTSNHVITLGAEYVPIENLAIDAQLPFALVKYTGTQKHMPPGAWDDGSNHATLTDFRVGARYQLLDEPYVALTPHIGVSIPVMDYQVIGFATGGRHLKQAHFGFDVGRTLNPVLPNLFVMAGYEFTAASSYDANAATASINQNRSDIDAQIGYLFLGGDLSVDAAYNWRFQHHGINFDDFGKLSTDLTQNHDPILKEDFMFIGGDVSYAINRKISISGSVRFFLRGYNTRDQSLYGIDLTWRAL
jgi:hypothetical protein